MMRETVIRNLVARFDAYSDLINQTDDAALQRKLPVERHKSLTEHLWCVVGARESYAQALTCGQWQGFTCSMAGYSQDDFRSALKKSAAAVMTALDEIEAWDEARESLLADLAEHEAMHEGGIIRHLYGTDSPIPASLKWA
jgi:hypothetical protein